MWETVLSIREATLNLKRNCWHEICLVVWRTRWSTKIHLQKDFLLMNVHPRSIVRHGLELCLMGVLALTLLGCSAGGGVGPLATDPATALTSSDLGAVEAALVADRLVAATAAPMVAASVLADVNALSFSFSHGGRQYRGGKGQNGLGGIVGRGVESCRVEIEGDPANPTRIRVADQNCQVVRLDDGSLLITLGNGNQIHLVRTEAESAPSTIIVQGVEWRVSFGQVPGDPLAILEHSVSHRVLTIEESDDGILSIIPDGSLPCRGRWGLDGALDVAGPDGARRFRFRGGREL
jgi:hypothetical protein